jgi:hypothetical protein
MKTIATLLKIGGWCAIAGATISLIICAVSAYYSNSFKTSAIKVEGEVIELIERNSEEHGLMFSPVFSFEDTKGDTHTIYSSSSSYPPSHSKGDKVVVYYDPTNPKKAKIDGFFSMWGMSAISGIISIGNYIMGIAFLIISHFVKPKPVSPPEMPLT